jgi:hypothetical protein
MVSYLLLCLLFVGRIAFAQDCSSYGVDFTNDGTYFIDGTSAVNFTSLGIFGFVSSLAKHYLQS